MGRMGREARSPAAKSLRLLMKNLQKPIIILLSCVIFALFFWVIFSPKEDISIRIKKTLKEQETQADLIFKKVSFEEVYGGIRYWKLVADKGSVNKSTGLATLKNASGTFFKAGKPVLNFHAPAALWDIKKKEIYLDNPIGYDSSLEKKITRMVRATRKKNDLSIFNLPEKFTGKSGYWFQANNLSWKMEDKMIFCSGKILLKKGEVFGRSEKLESDVGLETILLNGTPSPWISLEMKDGTFITAEAESFEVQSPKNIITANNNPVILWLDARVTSRTARYHQGQKMLELDKDVIINYRDINASGNSAKYFTAEQSIILSGKAKANQKNNRLSGDKIKVSLKENKISVLGKSKVIISEEEIKK